MITQHAPLNPQSLLPCMAERDLKPLKSRAREVLPEGSPCRALILSQPDALPEAEGVSLARALSRPLSDELHA